MITMVIVQVTYQETAEGGKDNVKRNAYNGGFIFLYDISSFFYSVVSGIIYFNLGR